MPSFELRTLSDYIAAYGDEEFGRRAYLGLGALDGPAGTDIAKTNYPLLTGTSGGYSAIYGPELWANINLRATVWASMPKVPYPKKFGWRAFTASPTNKAIGSADAGTIADTEIGTFVQVTKTPTIMYKNFDVGLLQQYASEGGQAIDWQTYRDLHGDLFAKGLNGALLTDVDTVAGNNIESIDRIVSSYGEVTNCGIHANDSDIYAIDRDAGASWADATVIHNSNVDRDFDLSLVNTLKRTVDQTCGLDDMGTTWWLTKHDTWQRWSEFLQPQQMFTEATFSTSAEGGLTSASGQAGGFALGTYMAHPMITDADTPADTLGRVYYLNTRYLKMGVAVPVKYVEVGGGNETTLLLNRFSTVGMFWMAGQPLTTAFFTLGKVRDMK